MRRTFCPTLAAIVLGIVSLVSAAPEEKTCGVYCSILEFASHDALQNAVNAQPPFLKEKHRQRLANLRNDADIQRAKAAGFNTLFMTIYPLQGKEWWSIPSARAMIQDA